MAIQLPLNFSSDIQSRNTNLVPVVRFRDASGSNPIYISTVSEMVGNNQWLPLLLNIPSLKESIDLEKRKYKISSVSLDISNLIYEGRRFSEISSELYGSMINTECRIYWTTQTAKTLMTTTDITASDSLAFQVFNGVIRRYEMTDEKVKIEVEDKTQR